ncbi:MAG: carboxymuconolactone decarboxylase family protein [Pseudomonadota bacterium]
MLHLFFTRLSALAIAGLLLLGSPAPAQSADTAASQHSQPVKIRLSAPRIPPLAESKWTEEQAKVLGPLKQGAPMFGTVLKAHNVLATLAQHEEARKKFDVWANHVMGATNTLPPREREILILRIGWLCQSEYEWGQHVVIGRAVGLTDEEIARIKLGAEAKGWSAHDALLIRAADELDKDAFVSDATWNGLAKTYNTQQMMDVVFTVGQYNLVSMALNSFGVQLDEGVKGF